MRHPASPLQERRKGAGASLLMSQVRLGAEEICGTRDVSKRGRTVSPVVTSGCPKRSKGGFPVGTRANTASQAERRKSVGASLPTSKAEQISPRGTESYPPQ